MTRARLARLSLLTSCALACAGGGGTDDGTGSGSTSAGSSTGSATDEPTSTTGAPNGFGPEQEFALRLNDLIKRGDIKANVRLQPGDVIIIPESMF